MKRDMELIRELMLQLESEKLPLLSEPIKDWNVDQVKYHKRLILDSKYAEGKNLSTFELEEYQLTRLTSKGHDFVDAARDKNVWKTSLNKVIEMGGGVTIAILHDYLVATIKKNLGLP
ncbi:DUF2513 domain-containing protein [Gimesia aquarii]|uniref:DUF2513 domain-containing protein n=1 Tax=Gimesia aquarii TaxID=2527964 RepID=A0A517VYE7_9PLAN|nr:DUF2513 domain-containing protein [Gimesia aquarii]QDT98022.1 hypothetical protein V144x_35060 [Gimesia aquarii]